MSVQLIYILYEAHVKTFGFIQDGS